MSKLKFLLKNYLTESIIALIVTLLAFAWVWQTNNNTLVINDMESWYSKWLDPIVTVATFLVALFVWYDNKIKEWEESLPKSLTVHYRWGQKYVMSAFNLKLLSENDIRAYAQAIGAQINNTGRLKLIPGITEKKVQRLRTNDGRYIRYYEVALFLSEPPASLENKYAVWVLSKTKEKEMPVLEDGVVNDFLWSDDELVYKRERSYESGFPLQPVDYDPKKERLVLSD